MLFEPTSRKLFIFAGRQDETYLSDMWEYDLASNTASKLFADFSTCGGPDGSFAQRAIIDCELKELYA